jgi:8-oxo-dGTP diphosphatase
MWDGSLFSGSKVALICGDSLIVYLRDEKPDIPFPGQWDLPGGGREGDEDPITCGLREIEEEFGLVLSRDAVEISQRHVSHAGGLDTYFCVAHIDANDIARIQFGVEGQRWQLMRIAEFIAHPNAVPHLRDRVRALRESRMI